MIYLILGWIGAIIALLLLVLALAKMEAVNNGLSSRVPDTFEWLQRKAMKQQKNRRNGRVIATQMALAPSKDVRHGATAQDRSVVQTSGSVVELHAFSRQTAEEKVANGELANLVSHTSHPQA